MLACRDGEFLRIWDLTTPTASLLFSAPIGRGFGIKIVWCRNGILAVLGSERPNRCFQFFHSTEPGGKRFELIRRIEVDDGRSYHDVKGTFSPEGTMLYYIKPAGDSPTILSVPEGKELAKLDPPKVDFSRPGHDYHTIHFAPTTHTIAVCFSESSNGNGLKGIVLYDIATGKQVTAIPISGITSPTGGGELAGSRFCGFSADQQSILTTARIGLRLSKGVRYEHYLVHWDTLSGKKLAQVAVDASKISALAEEQNILALGGPSSPGRDSLWNVVNILTPDATGSRCTLRMLLGHRKQCIAMANDPTNPSIKDYASNDISSLAISQNGKLLATQDSGSMEVQIWDLEAASDETMPAITDLP